MLLDKSLKDAELRLQRGVTFRMIDGMTAAEDSVIAL